MKKKRYLRWVFLLSGVFSLLTGCAGGGQTAEQTGKQEGYMYGVAGGCTAAGGVYVGQDSLIHYCDKETMADVILCHKPDCPHEPYDSVANPDPVCDAALNEDLNMKCIPFTDGEYVYLLGDKDVSRGVIYREKADGSERELLNTTEYQCLENANGYIKDGTAYLIANQPVVTEDNLGGTGSNMCYYVLAAVDLTNGSCTPLTQIREYDFQGMELLGTDGGTLYYYFSYWENSGDSDQAGGIQNKAEIYGLNLKTKEEQLVIPAKKMEGYSPLGIHDATLFMEKTEESVRLYESPLDSVSITASSQTLPADGMTFFNRWAAYYDEKGTVILADWNDVEAGNGKTLVARPLIQEGGGSE